MPADRYAARLCWNTKDWILPAGAAAASEGRDTYSARMGFGHEEWIFNYEWILDGWKYSFLQPVGRSLRKFQGNTIDVRLYTIAPESQWFYVAQIRSCEVLTEEHAEHARKEFKRRGWLKEMTQHVREVQGNEGGLRQKKATSIFNVRFRTVDVEHFDWMVPVDEHDPIRRVKRYNLVPWTNKRDPIAKNWASRGAAKHLKPTGKRLRAAIAAGEVNSVESELQNELFQLLVSKHGESSVQMEENFVDIKLWRDNSFRLIEVKSDGRPRFAIRQALGQLLDYAFSCEEKHETVSELIVAGPGELTSLDRKYLSYLRDRRGLPIRYVCMRRGVKSIDL